MKFVTALLMTSTLSLTGCAARYQPPSSGPTATIVFEKPQGSMFGVTQFNAIVSDAKCTDPRLLSVFSPTRTEPVSQVVPAETRVYFKSDVGRSAAVSGNAIELASCRQIVSFVPRQGEKYKLRQTLLPTSCSIELVQAADQKVPASTLFHPQKECPRHWLTG